MDRVTPADHGGSLPVEATNARRPLHQRRSWRTRRRSWCDLGPDVEPFLLHLYAALAEKERAVISQRAKAAWRRKGPRTGARQPSARRCSRGRYAAQKAEANADTDIVVPAIREAQAAGAKSLRQIAPP